MIRSLILLSLAFAFGATSCSMDNSNLKSEQILNRSSVDVGPDDEFQLSNSETLYVRDTTPPYIAGYLNYAAFRIPTLLADNRYIYTFAQGRLETHEDFGGQQHILFRRSATRGKRWQDMQVIAKGEPGFACGSLSPVLLGEGNLLLMWVEQHLTNDQPTRIFTIKSNNGGRSWGRKKEVTKLVKRPNEGQGNWYGVGPSSGLVKRDGMHKGRILIVASQSGVTIDDKDYAFSPSHLIYSDDNGDSWSVGATMSVKSKEATLVELVNGDLLVNARNNDFTHRVVGVSKDGGLSFQVDGHGLLLDAENSKNQGKKLTDCPEGGSDCGIHSGLLVHSKNEKNGRSNLIFSNPQGVDFERTIGVMQLSENGGRSWTKQLRFTDNSIGNERPGYSGYSNMVSLDQGKSVAVIFERGGTVRQKYLRGKAMIENETWQINFDTFENIECPKHSKEAKEKIKSLHCRDKVAQSRHHMIDFKIIPFAAFKNKNIAASVEEPQGGKLIKCVNIDSSIGQVSPQGDCE